MKVLLNSSLAAAPPAMNDGFGVLGRATQNLAEKEPEGIWTFEAVVFKFWN